MTSIAFDFHETGFASLTRILSKERRYDASRVCEDGWYGDIDLERGMREDWAYWWPLRRLGWEGSAWNDRVGIGALWG